MRSMQAPEICEIANKLLADQPDPIVQYCLLRDVLRLPEQTPELIAARKRRDESRWVAELASEQRPDGGWGTFHTCNYRLKQKIGDTEIGAERAMVLGLDADHPIVQRTIAYLVGVLAGERQIPDRTEHNDGWLVGVRMFAAGTLACLAPDHAALEEPWALWAEVLHQAFANGDYRRAAECSVLRKLAGVHDDVGYLTIRGRYVLALLGTRAHRLPEELARTYITWLWQHDIGYLEDQLFQLPPRPRKSCFIAHDLLSRFPGWAELAGETIAWFLQQRNAQGLWDFGARSSWYNHLPLSESWRKRGKRQQDWSTWVLLLLKRYLDVERR